ncbi:sodium/hydrogen exchanger 6 [Tanacetum coccineum]
MGPLQDPTTATITTITITNGDGMQRVRTFEKQYPQNKVQQMGGARGRVYAIDGRILMEPEKNKRIANVGGSVKGMALELVSLFYAHSPYGDISIGWYGLTGLKINRPLDWQIGPLLTLKDYQLKQKNKDTNQTRNSFSALDSASTSGNHNDDSIIVGEVIADPLDDARSESSDDMENVYDETLDANVQLKQSGASTPHKKVILGDFNASLSLDDTTHGASNINISMCEFNECVHNIEVTDVNSTGLRYTWNQKPHAKLGILKKIDRVMCNLGFNQEFPGSYAIFQPYRISDHLPAEVDIHGHNVFKLVKRLRLMKKPMRKLMHSQGNLYDLVDKLRKELDAIQIALDKDLDSVVLREEEAIYLNAFTQASLDEERYLKQRSKIEWLRVGDCNSSYFHQSVKAQVSRSRVDCVQGSDGIIQEGINVPVVFVNHYKLFLGEESVVNPLVHEGLFSSRLNSDKAFEMKAWDVVGGDVCNVINDFFLNGKILKEINHTIIALLPKIITNRIKEGLNDVVSINQSAFILGYSISDNILLTQDLMHNYHSNRGPPRCAFKIDIQKAYDTVSWKFLEEALVGFEFHVTMIKEDDEFKYHNRCEKQKIVNICFADDLIFFARGDVHSTNIIMEGLEEFKGVSGLDMKRGKAKVSWDDVCLPKCKGGLGIRKLADFNITLMSAYIWNILTHKETMWVRWIHAYKLKTRSFWDVHLGSNEMVAKLLLGLICGTPMVLLCRILRIELLVVPENKEDNLLWKASDGLFNEFSDNVSSIVGRLILASSAYFIWQERNNRIHSKPSRNEDQVAKIIVEMVRLKLASINFKNKESVRLMKAIWKIA